MVMKASVFLLMVDLFDDKKRFDFVSRKCTYSKFCAFTTHPTTVPGTGIDSIFYLQYASISTWNNFYRVLGWSLADAILGAATILTNKKRHRTCSWSSGGTRSPHKSCWCCFVLTNFKTYKLQPQLETKHDICTSHQQRNDWKQPPFIFQPCIFFHHR